MKTLTMLLMAFAVLLSGCVVYDPPYRDSGVHRGDREREHEHERDRERDREGPRDSDHDGVPDRMDRRPYDRNRY